MHAMPQNKELCQNNKCIAYNNYNGYRGGWY